MNNLNLFDNLRRGWWYFTIDNIISECIDFLIRNILQISVPINFLFWTSVLFFSFKQLHHYVTSAYQPHHYSSTSSLPVILDFLLFQALNLLTASFLFPSFYLFLAFLWMLWMMDTRYKAKFTLWKTLIMFIA